MGLWDTKENFLTDVSSKLWCPARTTMGTPLKIPSMGESLLISLTRKTLVRLTLITTMCIFFHSLDAAISETGNMYSCATRVSATCRGDLCAVNYPSLMTGHHYFPCQEMIGRICKKDSANHQKKHPLLLFLRK
uniref:Uncharacterized protein n=1 Tax=Pipistrellus kuhlii TaxID=59472 RepID=A0A7J7Y9B6_PIPKU|nr:hypothetical protein mPipKuh1_010262 [Pipistrellus kuhlii]